MRTTITLAVLFLSCALGAQTTIGSDSGKISGLTTVKNTKKFVLKAYSVQTTKFHFDVKATGSGSNTLKVQLQKQNSNGSWSSMAGSYINVPVGCTGRLTWSVAKGTTQVVRLRLSRKLLTKKIEWKVTVTR